MHSILELVSISKRALWSPCQTVTRIYSSSIHLLLPQPRSPVILRASMVHPLANSEISPTNMMLRMESCHTLALWHAVLCLQALISLACFGRTFEGDRVLDMLPNSMGNGTVFFVFVLLGLWTGRIIVRLLGICRDGRRKSLRAWFGSLFHRRNAPWCCHL